MKLNNLMLFLAAATLAGCQTSSHVSSAATNGGGITCNEISQAFTAYQQDRQSAEAWADLSQLISPAAGNYANMGVETAARYYDQIKATTDLAMAVRGCQPVG
ncbi:hypothetical protein [Marinobacter sp.]|uniref:hypothetical protein n=1 Tax=Marinobacter sp. TaxID=50741 RepID=UPI0034A41141